MPCKQGESADVKGSECRGKQIRAGARINVGGRAYYCGREAALLRPPARNRVYKYKKRKLRKKYKKKRSYGLELGEIL